MKKIVLFSLFCTLALCCYAQEGMKNDENNEATQIYSDLSLPLLGFDNSSRFKSTMFGRSLVWEQADLGLTKYANYRNKSFFETNIGPRVCIVVGAVAMIVGPIMSATSDSSSSSAHIPGVITFSFGLGAFVGGLIWGLSN